MKNADKFKGIFGTYATELWSKSYKEFSDWLNEDVPDTNVGDMISRQAAINAIENTDCELSSDAWDELTDAIMSVPSVQTESRWISVDERLPEPNQLVGKTRKYYLVQDEYEDVLTASYNKRADGFIYWEQMYDIEPLHYEVVAWMELPEPYRKETDDE